MCTLQQKSFVTRLGRRAPRELLAPTVPLADPVDGLLTLEDLEQPIRVLFKVWNEASPGDQYKLLWNGVEVGEAGTIADNEVPGDPLSLDIPDALLEYDGSFQIAFKAVDHLGGQDGVSLGTTIIIDRTPPGGDLIAAMIFPQVTHDGVLTSAELEALGDVLTAEIPGYAGMAWGDKIQTFWGTKVGPEHTVVEAEVTMDRVMLTFQRAFLESLGDITEPVYFIITDRAGNVSHKSESKTFRLFLQEIPTDFPAPLCAQALDGVVDDADARASVAVAIPRYPDPQVDDKITLYWGDSVLPEAGLEAGDDTQDPMFEINVRYATIALSGDGQVSLTYEVRREGVLIGSSLPLEVTVNLTLPGPQDPDPETPENEALDKPVIRGTSTNANNEDNVIDEDDFLLEAKAIISWKDDFIISDIVTLYWGSQPTPVVFPIKSTDVNKDLVLTVPNSLVMAEGTGDGIRVFYTVSHVGNPNTSKSAFQLVSVRSQGELPGGIAGLDAPVFSNANENNTISPILSPDGTPIHIAPYENIDKYPRVTIVFHGYNAANGNTPVPGASVEETHVLDEFEIVNGYDFRVPDSKLRLICTGRAEAYYKVEGPNGPVNSSVAPVIIRMAIPGVGC